MLPVVTFPNIFFKVMKSFGIIFLSVLVAFVGYQYAYPKLDEKFDFQKMMASRHEPAVTVDEAHPANKDEPASQSYPTRSVADSPPMPERPKHQDSPNVASTPSSVGSGEMPRTEVGPEDFVPPTFPPLDEVVKGWKEIPKKTFPRQVKLLKDVEFKMSVGSSRVKAGGNAMALGQEGENLIVAPTENSPAHSQVALDDTDLKDTLNQAYDAWKVKMADWQRRQWEYRKTAAANAQNVAKTEPQSTTRSDLLKRNPDGSYDILLSSMKTGQVNEITPSNIKKWGQAQASKINGKDYITVIVNYTTKTMFGDFDVEAQARISNGRVEKWVYTGSGEVVP